MNKNIFHIIGDFFSDYKHVFFQVLGVVLLTICSSLIGSHAFAWNLSTIILCIFLFLSIVLYISGTIIFYKSQTKISELKAENDKAKAKINDAEETIYHQNIRNYESLRDLIDIKLRYIFHDNLSLTSNERISLYYHNTNDFLIAGRYSEHPEYKKLNRMRFPDKEGCIAKAWLGSEDFYENDLDIGATDYLDIIKNKYNISPITAQNLSMPSKCFFSKVIKDYKHDRLGVIVIESTQQNRFNNELEKLSNLIEKESKYFADHLINFKLVDPENIYKKGNGDE